MTRTKRKEAGCAALTVAVGREPTIGRGPAKAAALPAADRPEEEIGWGERDPRARFRAPVAVAPCGVMAAASCEFQLPLTADDLLRGDSSRHYVVQEVLSVRELPPAIAGKARALPLLG